MKKEKKQKPKYDEATMKRCGEVTAILLIEAFDAGKRSAYQKIIQFEVFLLSFIAASLLIINLF